MIPDRPPSNPMHIFLQLTLLFLPNHRAHTLRFQAPSQANLLKDIENYSKVSTGVKNRVIIENE